MTRSATGATIALAAVLVIGAAFGLHLVTDPDVFLHAAVGKAIWNDFGSLGTASFHDVAPAKPYVADKWLVQLASAAAASAGDTGLMALQIVLTTLVAGAWFWMLRRFDTDPWIALAATALALVAAAHRLEPRPETLSHALLAVVAGLLAGPARPRVLAGALVAIAVVWVNAHGYFVNGLLAVVAALGAALLGASPAALIESRSKAAKHAALLLVLMTGASLVHPQGWRALVWPFQQIAEARANPVYAEAIGELKPTWQLLEGASAWHLALFPAALLAGLALATAKRGLALRSLVHAAVALPWLILPPDTSTLWPHRVTWALACAALVEVVPALREKRTFAALLFAGFGVLAMPAIRNVGLVAPFALALLAPAWSQAWRELAAHRPRARTILVAASFAVAASATGARLLDHLAPGTYRGPGWTGWGVDARVFPEESADFLLAQKLPAPILNDFQSGGYLLWRLPVGGRVFIAGNTSLYPIAFLEEYRRDVMGAHGSLDAVVARFGVSTVILAHAAMETPHLVARLAASPRFALVHVDDAAAVWVRRDHPEGARAIARLGEVDDPRLAALVSDAHTAEVAPALPLARPRLFPALNAGIFLRAHGRADLAHDLGEELWPHAPGALLAAFLAGTAEESGRLIEETPRLETIERTGDGSVETRSWLARALFVRGATALDRALASTGGEPPAESGAAAALDAVISDLSRSRQLAPGEPGPTLGLARARAASGDEAGARALVRELLDGPAKEEVRRFIATDPWLSRLVDLDARSE